MPFTPVSVYLTNANSFTTSQEYLVAVVCVTTTAMPDDILIGGSPVGGSSTNNYVNTRVLSQCLLLPAHTIGNEN